MQLCLLSQPRLLGSVRALIETLAARIGFCQRGCGELVLAVDEVLTNIIRHGYEGAEDGRIWISFWSLQEPSVGIRVAIEDHQQVFDPSEIPDRDLEEVRPGGLGLSLLRTLTRSCRHEVRPEGGMRVVIEKFCEDVGDPEDPESGGESAGTEGTHP